MLFCLMKDKPTLDNVYGLQNWKFFCSHDFFDHYGKLRQNR